jgi:soluble lytic murein transglycosylase-like protein
MAVRAQSSRLSRRPPQKQPRRLFSLLRRLPAWVVLLAVVAVLLVSLYRPTLCWLQQVMAAPGVVASLFTPEVRYWAEDIERWANEHDLDPNLLATVMQIESCGHPTVSSYAGAKGLFQVMPFHFQVGEDQLDPDTNALRGASFLKYCEGYTGGDIALMLACYNGGPGTASKPYAQWSDQTQRYLLWGIGIYADASTGQRESQTLQRWLDAGGRYLCRDAATTLGL